MFSILWERPSDGGLSIISLPTGTAPQTNLMAFLRGEMAKSLTLEPAPVDPNKTAIVLTTSLPLKYRKFRNAWFFHPELKNAAVGLQASRYILASQVRFEHSERVRYSALRELDITVEEDQPKLNRYKAYRKQLLLSKGRFELELANLSDLDGMLNYNPNLPDEPVEFHLK